MPSNRKATKDVWITIATAATRCGLDSTNVGKRARRGEFGKTALLNHRGHQRRLITEAGLARWKARQKAKGR